MKDVKKMVTTQEEYTMENETTKTSKTTMKAIVNEKFGSPEVLKLQQIDKPIPIDNQILVKTYVTSINTIDFAFRSGAL